MLSIVLSPYIWVYVAIVLFIVLRMIATRVTRALDPSTINPHRSVNAIPRVFLIGMALYCTVGPNVALLGQTLGEPFLDRTEYILAQLLGVPLILLFTTPFFILMNHRLEFETRSVALNENERFMSLSTKMLVGFVFNLAGSLVTMITAALSLEYAIGGGAPYSFDGRLVGAGVVVVVVATANLVLIVRQIIGPIHHFMAAVETLFSTFAGGRGRLDIETQVVARDELGHLADGLHRFVRSLGDLMRRVQNQAREAAESGARLIREHEQLVETLSQLSSLAQSMGAEFHALGDQVAHTAFTVDETRGFAGSFQETVGQYSRQLRDASTELEQLGTSTRRTREVVEDAVSVFSELERVAVDGVDAGNRGRETSVRVSEAATVIGQALSVIQDIAARTQLLAMNAAIEAAHAGDQGRGFSVVAGEIRSLSENTSQQARQVTSSLQLLQELITTSAELSETTAGHFNQVQSVAQQTAQRFSELTSSIAHSEQAGTRVAQHVSGVIDGNTELMQRGENLVSAVDEIASTIKAVQDISTRSTDAFERLTGTVAQLSGALQASSDVIRQSSSSGEVLHSQIGGFEVDSAGD